MLRKLIVGSAALGSVVSAQDCRGCGAPGCFNFPDEDYSATNHGKPGGWVSVSTQDTAPDFTLNTVDGKSFNLKTALKEKPVMMQFGAYT